MKSFEQPFNLMSKLFERNGVNKGWAVAWLDLASERRE